MKILSIYIDNFGKLSNYKLELNGNLNCIFRENGYGKTTLAVFIKSMLYGMQKSTKRSPLENDRKHYSPWGGGAYGGTLDIETDRGRYRIERSFGKKESDDTFALRDLATGLESRDYTENIGVELFGIDSASFEKSVFAMQGKTPEISMTSDIGAKLGNMLESSADMAESDRAIELLDKYMKRFKLKKGSGGLIDELKDELAGVLTESDECRRATESAAEQKLYLSQLSERANGIKAREKELLDRLEEERAGAIRDVEYRRYLEYIEDAEHHKKKADELRAFFPEKLPDKDELERIRTFCRGVELKEKSPDFELSPSDSVKYENYRSRFGATPPSDSELDSVSERLSALKLSESEAYSFRISDPPERDEPISRASQKTFFAAFAVCLAAAIGLGVLCLVSFSLMLAIGAGACAAAGIAFFVAFAVKRSSINKAELANEEKYRASLLEYERLNESQEEKRIENERERFEIEMLLGKYYPSCPGGADSTLARLYTDVESYRALICSLEQLDAKNAEKRKYIAELHNTAREMLRTYGVDATDGDYDGAIRCVFEKMQELARNASDYAEIRRRAAQYAKEKGIDPNSPPVSNDTRRTESELAALREELNTVSGEIGAIENRIASLEQIAEKQHSLLHRADALRAEIAQAEDKWACAEKARNLLEKACDGLSSKYLGTMEENFEKNCERFGSLLPSPQIDAKLGLTFREGGGDRDSEWYSAGMRCIINLCMRLSLTDALFENEKPFMVLDDPFTDLDGKHLDAAKQIVTELSRERQIIYLTCSEERRIGE